MTYFNHFFKLAVAFIQKTQEMINKGSRYNCIDANQAEIVEGLRKVGVSVLITSHVGHGFPDIIAGLRGRNYLIEIKNPKSYYGKAGFSKTQKLFNDKWKGEMVYIVKTIDQALKVVGLTQG